MGEWDFNRRVGSIFVKDRLIEPSIFHKERGGFTTQTSGKMMNSYLSNSPHSEPTTMVSANAKQQELRACPRLLLQASRG